MATIDALEPDEAEDKLKDLAVEWSIVSGSALERVYEFQDFATALDFVNQVGHIAEKENHHPDIQLSWGKVVVTTTSHDAGGLTEKDFALAGAVDSLEK